MAYCERKWSDMVAAGKITKQAGHSYEQVDTFLQVLSKLEFIADTERDLTRVFGFFEAYLDERDRHEADATHPDAYLAMDEVLVYGIAGEQVEGSDVTDNLYGVMLTQARCFVFNSVPADQTAYQPHAAQTDPTHIAGMIQVPITSLKGIILKKADPEVTPFGSLAFTFQMPEYFARAAREKLEEQGAKMKAMHVYLGMLQTPLTYELAIRSRTARQHVDRLWPILQQVAASNQFSLLKVL